MSLERYCKQPIVRISPEKTIPAACQSLEEHDVGCPLAELANRVSETFFRKPADVEAED
jgi:hypothetical protein